MNTRSEMAINKKWWEERVASHVESNFYDVEDFLNGNPRNLTVERKEVGSVKDKSLLHMQCHFGLDTLSWARYGATVTGVDFSKNAIEAATALAEKAEIDARFVQSNIFDAPKKIDEKFDVVFTSWGVLGWLPDHKKWAEVAAHFVKPGGTFYILELHPFSLVFNDSEEEGPGKEPVVRIEYDYFFERAPFVEETPGTYAEPKAQFENNDTRYWAFELGALVTYLIEAGLEIEFVREHDFTCFRQWPGLKEEAPDIWRLPKSWPKLPLSFSIKATKPK